MTEIILNSKDEINLHTYNNTTQGGKWLMMQVYDEYEGRGASIAFYTRSDIDRLIGELQKVREEVTFDE